MHTQLEVFFQTNFHLGMKFCKFHPGIKLSCKQDFFHSWTIFIPACDFISVTCKHTLSVLPYFELVKFAEALAIFYGIPIFAILINLDSLFQKLTLDLIYSYGQCISFLFYIGFTKLCNSNTCVKLDGIKNKL